MGGMINRAGEMAVFVRAVQLGSYSAAARSLQMTPSAVSKLVGRIEGRLGVRLVVRSTRSLRLTAEGECYYGRALRIVGDIEETERAVSSGTDEPRGPLRVNANIPFAVHCLVPLVPEFLERHPAVTLDLSLTDSTVDLIDERADVAIRTGPLRDSALKARKLLVSRRVVVGAPSYFARHGTPGCPDELEHHNCLNFNFRRSGEEWPFTETAGNDGALPRALPVRGNFQANNGETVRQLALAGLGIARLSAFHVGRDLVAGRLVAVLDAYNPGDTEPVHAVYVGHEHLSNRIRAFIDFLAERVERQRTPPVPAAAL